MKLFASLAATAVASAAAHDYKICSGTTDGFGLTKVDLSPDPVPSYAELKVTFTGTPTHAFDAGSKATLTVKLLGIKLATLNFDACKDLGMKCPVPAGTEVTGTITQAPHSASPPRNERSPPSPPLTHSTRSYKIPSAVPAGLSADVELVLKDGAGASVTCVDVKAKLGSSKSSFKAVRGASYAMVDHRADFDTIFDREHVEYLYLTWAAEHAVETPQDPAEFVKRLNIFEANLKGIYRHNHNMGTTYKKAMNQFGHLTAEEFKANYLGFNRPAEPSAIPRNVFTYPSMRKQELADGVDWVAKGAVTVPKNQGSCGSCWSYSTTGAVEGAYQIKTGTLVSLSEQQLVSCDKTDSGCNGGLMDSAFDWIADNGLCTEDDYPYVQGSSTDVPACETTCTPVSGTGVASHKDVDKTEAALMAAVSGQPVSIAIEADQTAFQFYSSGAMTGK